MERTNLSSEIDGALAGRNAGSRGFWECARSGNGNMRTDLMDEDDRDYQELEGLGEAIEEMTLIESAAEDRGDRSAFKAYREPRAGEQPPYAPKPGKAWLRRRIRTNTRRPGGNHQARVRWVQVSPAKYQQIVQAGAMQVSPTLAGLAGISSTWGIPLVIGAGLLIGAKLGRRRRA